MSHIYENPDEIAKEIESQAGEAFVFGEEFACSCCTDAQDDERHNFDYLALAKNNYIKSRN